MFIIPNPAPAKHLPQLSVEQRGKSIHWATIPHGTLAAHVLDRFTVLGLEVASSSWWVRDNGDYCLGDIQLVPIGRKMQKYRHCSRKWKYNIAVTSDHRGREGLRFYGGVTLPEGCGFMTTAFRVRRSQTIRSLSQIEQTLDLGIKGALTSFDDAQILMDYMRRTKISRAVGCQIIVKIFEQKDMGISHVHRVLPAWDAYPDTQLYLDNVYRACGTVQGELAIPRQIDLLRNLKVLVSGYGKAGL